MVETVTGPIDAGTGGLEVDPDGNIYMSDFGALLTGADGTRIFRVTPAGSVSVFASGFVGATGSTFDADGNFLQANIGGNVISRIHPDGAIDTLSSEGLVNPVGIILNAEGVLFVANCGNGTIGRVTPTGRTEVFAADSLLRCPNGIAAASDGNLYVSNFANGDVLRVDPSGTVTRLAALPGNNNGHLTWGNGVLYVAARTANQLYELHLDGSFRLLAGTGERGLRDGPALEATLSLPNDLALSPDGSVLYWNDVGVLNPDPRVLAPTVVRSLTLDRGR